METDGVEEDFSLVVGAEIGIADAREFVHLPVGVQQADADVIAVHIAAQLQGGVFRKVYGLYNFDGSEIGIDVVGSAVACRQRNQSQCNKDDSFHCGFFFFFAKIRKSFEKATLRQPQLHTQ